MAEDNTGKEIDIIYRGFYFEKGASRLAHQKNLIPGTPDLNAFPNEEPVQYVANVRWWQVGRGEDANLYIVWAEQDGKVVAGSVKSHDVEEYGQWALLTDERVLEVFKPKELSDEEKAELTEKTVESRLDCTDLLSRGESGVLAVAYLMAATTLTAMGPLTAIIGGYCLHKASECAANALEQEVSGSANMFGKTPTPARDVSPANVAKVAGDSILAAGMDSADIQPNGGAPAA